MQLQRSWANSWCTVLNLNGDKLIADSQTHYDGSKGNWLTEFKPILRREKLVDFPHGFKENTSIFTGEDAAAFATFDQKQ